MKTKINIWAESHNQFSNQPKDLSMYKLVDMWISKYPDIIFERKNYLDRINYISSNARKYYLENFTFDKYVNSLYELIDINKII